MHLTPRKRTARHGAGVLLVAKRDRLAQVLERRYAK